MITAQNETNSLKYIALFKEAYDFLVANYQNSDDAELQSHVQSLINAHVDDEDDSAKRFTSVQEYFSYLQDLWVLGGKKFIMLPLDEPVLEVDANKREIIIPAEFKKNGVGVVGDHISESLVFKINRFFDYTDLDEMQVVVQWENANKEVGISDIFVKDRTADYLYLLWPLTHDVTDYPGTIKFSLRFYHAGEGAAENGSLFYSFSTKIASATINNAQHLNIQSYTHIDPQTEFSNVIRNSQNTAAENAAEPEFIVNLDLSADEEVREDNSVVAYRAYIDEDNPNQLLKVQAVSRDTGTISYKWYYRDTITERTRTDSTPYLYSLTPTTVYERTTDNAPVANKIYYTKVSEDQQTGPQYAVTDFEGAGNNDLYEKFSTITVSYPITEATVLNDSPIESPLPHVVGKYWAEAKNSVGGNSDTKMSIIVDFPEPEILEFIEGGDLPDYMFLDDNNQGTLQVSIEKDAYAKDTYAWYYSDVRTGGNWTAVGDTSNVYANGNTLTFNAKEPGYYKVQVTSTLNYEPLVKESQPCKVSGKLAAPRVLVPAKDTAVSSLTDNASERQLVVEIEEFNSEFDSERITYQWYKYDNNGDRVIIDGATQPTLAFARKDDTPYCCEITNWIGTESASIFSPTYSVQPYRLVEQPATPEVPQVISPSVNVLSASQVPQDVDESANFVINQGAVIIANDNGTYAVRNQNGELNAYARSSGDPHKWVALDIATNLGIDYIVSCTLSDSVVKNQPSEGHFLYWINADSFTGDTITISASGHENATITLAPDFIEG